MKQDTTGIINKDNTEKNVLTCLKNLIALSIPKEDFAMMAGDVVTSAEILEIVVDYIKRENQDGANSETEVKVRTMFVCCAISKGELLLITLVYLSYSSRPPTHQPTHPPTYPPTHPLTHPPTHLSTSFNFMPI